MDGQPATELEWPFSCTDAICVTVPRGEGVYQPPQYCLAGSLGTSYLLTP